MLGCDLEEANGDFGLAFAWVALCLSSLKRFW